jgi:hypothetical protein
VACVGVPGMPAKVSFETVLTCITVHKPYNFTSCLIRIKYKNINSYNLIFLIMYDIMSSGRWVDR